MVAIAAEVSGRVMDATYDVCLVRQFVSHAHFLRTSEIDFESIANEFGLRLAEEARLLAQALP